MVEIDDRYTQDDHVGRENDAYAETKYRLTLRWLLKAGVPLNGRLLNVGCGGGLFHRMADESGYSDVWGIEPDPQAFALAQRTAPRHHHLENVALEAFDTDLLFDAIVIHDVLEHLPDDHAAVAHLADLLKPLPTAILIASVPAWEPLYGHHDIKLGHYRRYSRRTFRRLLGGSFEIVTMRQLGLLGVPAALYYSRYRKVAYPVGTGGWADRVMTTSCRVEERISTPLGTSILAVATPLGAGPCNGGSDFHE